MPLVVETGSGLDPSATSYVTEAEIIDYAAARGITIGEPAATLAGIKAMDFLEIQIWKGEQVAVGVQPLAFPRQNIKVGCATLPADQIPMALKNGQCELAMQSFNGIDLTPSRPAEAAVKSETIGGSQGQVQTEYFGPALTSPLLTRATALLKPLVSLAFDGIQVLRA